MNSSQKLYWEDSKLLPNDKSFTQLFNWVLPLLHASIISAPMILSYYNPVSILFFTSCLLLTNCFSKHLTTALWFYTWRARNLPSLPHLESYHSSETFFRELINFVDVFLSSWIHFLSFHTCLKAISTSPEFYLFRHSPAFPFKLFVHSLTFEAAPAGFLPFLL